MQAMEKTNLLLLLLLNILRLKNFLMMELTTLHVEDNNQPKINWTKNTVEHIYPPPNKLSRSS